MKKYRVGIQPVQVVRRAKEIDPEAWDEERPPHIFTATSLQTVMREEQPTDAHFVPYYFPDDELWPACAKVMLGLARQQGGDILTRVLVLDLDIEPHRAWAGEDEALEFGAVLGGKIEAGEVPNPAYAYTTRGGARLVYTLKRPVPVDVGETLHRGLAQQVREALKDSIVSVDKSGSNWDRCFRLPRVVRDGQLTSKAPYFFYVESTGTLDPDDIEPIGTPTVGTTRAIAPMDLDMPTPEEAQALLREPGAPGYTRRTKWCKEARTRMRGREAFGAMFEDAPAPDAGHRDTTIQSMAGGAVSMLFNLPDASPEGIFALLLDWVLKIPLDECDVPPDEALWVAVLKYWAKEEARAAEEAQAAEARASEEAQAAEARAVEEAQATEVRAQRAEHAIDSIVEGMMNWHQGVKDAKSQDEARAIAMRSLIALNTSSGAMFLMERNGYYSSSPIKLQYLRTEIVGQGLQDLIPLDEMVGETMREIKPATIMERHAITYRAVILAQSAPGGHIFNGNLILPTCRLRTDLEPHFHPEVDIWLHKLLGEDYNDVEQWIANALALDEGCPIAALSLTGAPSTGKKMFAQGLAECADTYPASVVSGDVAFSQFNASLREAFLIHVDEGLPTNLRGGRSLKDIFRGIVSGDPIQVEAKYQPTMLMKNPMRLLFTTNQSVTKALAGGGDLSTEDIESLALRLRVVRARKEAAEYLAALGGRFYTAREGAKWISGDGGAADSDFIVARHFLWLHFNRLHKAERGSRLLVEGQVDWGVLNELRFGSEAAADVIDAIIACINHRNKVALSGYTEDHEGIHVTARMIKETVNRTMARRITDVKAARVLGQLSVKKERGEKLVMGQRSTGLLTWYTLDEEALLDYTREMGYTCKVLELRDEARRGR